MTHFTNEIISYRDMCEREGVQTLQRGMNFHLNGKLSVILMSLRSNAPYRDRVEEQGRILIYEGHDAPHTKNGPDPKHVDQPEFNPGGTLTQNGLFHQAAQHFRSGHSEAELVRVYQKLWNGVWSDNGTFLLTDSWRARSDGRHVFKFRLEIAAKAQCSPSTDIDLEHTRIIPSEVKQAVWKRDKGKCVECGSTTNLHFDHIIPYSKGGSSLTEDNIQLLCARHNLKKHDRIQ